MRGPRPEAAARPAGDNRTRSRPDGGRTGHGEEGRRSRRKQRALNTAFCANCYRPCVAPVAPSPCGIVLRPVAQSARWGGCDRRRINAVLPRVFGV